MNLAWTAWLDEAWRAPAFPVWVTLVVAGFAVLVLLVALMRAEHSAAGATLAVIALLAILVAAVTVLRDGSESDSHGPTAAAAPQPAAVALPALTCLDELAGDTVQAACERALFGAPDHAAAAVSYVAAQIDRLTERAGATATVETIALRNALQRDRYGLAAHVLATRDGCTPSTCAAFRVLTDTSRIVANMNARAYEALIGRHMLTWPSVAAASSAAEGSAAAATAGLPPSVPTGRPTTIDFPTSDSIPPISIMSGEPAQAAPQTAPAARVQAPQPRPAPPAAKRQSKSPPAAPVQLAPAAPGGDNR